MYSNLSLKLVQVCTERGTHSTGELASSASKSLALLLTRSGVSLLMDDKNNSTWDNLPFSSVTTGINNFVMTKTKTLGVRSKFTFLKFAAVDQGSGPSGIDGV